MKRRNRFLSSFVIYFFFREPDCFVFLSVCQFFKDQACANSKINVSNKLPNKIENNEVDELMSEVIIG